MTGQDSDAVAANQASSSLGLLTSRPCEMAESGSVGDAQSATLTLASDATTEGLVDGTADALVASLSSYVDADACPETPLRRRRLTAVRHLRSGRRLTTSSGGDATTGTVMASATDDVTEAMLLSAVPGESPVTAVSENLKLGGRRLDADAPEGEALAAPLTAAEMAAGVQAAQMALPQTSAEETANATAVDMQLAQYGANVVGSSGANATGAAEPISLVCAGTYDELTVNCTVNTVDQCLTYDESLDYWDADLCAADIDRSNDVNITCVCPYIPPSTSFDMSASTEAVAGYYASMMADGLSPEVFTKNLLLVYTYAVIFGLTAVFLAYAVWADRKDAAANAAEVAPAADEAPLRLGDQHDFVEESMEEVVVENWGYKWYLAILDNHLHLAWLWFDEAEPRWLRVLLLPLDWVTVMFAEAVGGSYAYPTGLCDQDKFHKDPDACEGIRHPYTKDEQVCRFNLLTEQCTYVPPDTGGAWLDGSMIQVVILTTFIIVPTELDDAIDDAARDASDAKQSQKLARQLKRVRRKLASDYPGRDKLYEVDFSAEEEAEPVERWQKAACAIALFFLAIYLMWWTLAYTLSVRNTPGAGASAVRLWWRMTMFAQIITIVVFEPLEILVLNVFLPGALSPVMKHKGDPAATVDFPYRTPLADRASALLRRHPAKAPAMASRIDYRDASSALRDRRTTAEPRAARPCSPTRRRARGSRSRLRRRRPPQGGEPAIPRCALGPAEIEHLEPDALLAPAPLRGRLRRGRGRPHHPPGGRQGRSSTRCSSASWASSSSSRTSRSEDVLGHAGPARGFMMFLFVALLNPIRCLCRKKKKKETGRKRRASDAKNSPRTEAVLRAAGVDVGAGDLGVSREFVDWAAARKITPLQRRVRDIKAKRAKP
ncbi:hypothetical protein JL721_4349 [Aureococcus anophagefferens]|nr:hypothetical protein JL721_4349 [Aureococcus anophagefferens]